MNLVDSNLLGSVFYIKLLQLPKTFTRNNPRKIIAIINFKNVEAIKPKKDPNAALVARLTSLSLVSSPAKAPKNGPMTIPPGTGDKIPTIRPIVVPIIPAFVPPNFLVPKAGII